MNKEKPLTIGKLAQRAKVNTQTIYFYEREGVIESPKRNESGYRLYDNEMVRKVRFIKKAQEIGFTLKEIKDLLNLRINKRTNCTSVRHRAEDKLSVVQEKLTQLQLIETTLKGLITSCASETTTDVCPILDALEPED